jgi:UPF0755 protein
MFKSKPKDNYEYEAEVMKRPVINLKFIIATAIFAVIFLFMGFVYVELYVKEAQSIDEVNFTIEPGETVDQIAEKLKTENIIKNTWIFKKYLVLKGIDKRIQAGEFKVIYPITLVRVASSLKYVIAEQEKTITILPGWNLREIAEYFKSEEIIDDVDEFYDLVGKSAVKYSGNAPKLSYEFKLLNYKPNNVSYEGYLAPETYRIFSDSSIKEILVKIMSQQNRLFTNVMYDEINRRGRSVHEILTMASILEREVRTREEKAKVADIFWRRYDNNWALQADSTVHYSVNKKGDVFTTKEDRDSNSPWNTYKFPGLPPGPISSPDIDSIKAAIYPRTNNYWYFLTDFDGNVWYAEDLDEHNNNVQKYLR